MTMMKFLWESRGKARSNFHEQFVFRFTSSNIFCLFRNISSQAEKRAQTAYGGKPQLLGVLNWISINMEKLMVDPKAAQKFVQQQLYVQPQQPKVGIEIVYNFIGDPNAKKEHEAKIQTKPVEPEVDTTTSTSTNNNNTSNHDSSDEHSEGDSDSEEDYSDSDDDGHFDGHDLNDDGLVNVSKEKGQQYPTTTAHKYV